MNALLGIEPIVGHVVGRLCLECLQVLRRCRATLARRVASTCVFAFLLLLLRVAFRCDLLFRGLALFWFDRSAGCACLWCVGGFLHDTLTRGGLVRDMVSILLVQLATFNDTLNNDGHRIGD